MDLTFLMNFIAPFLLGAAIAYLVMRTSRIGRSQRIHTERATEALYDATERARERREEHPDRAPR